MFENKFYKVAQSGGSYVTADFYNPVTGEHKHVCVRDYDYADCSRDNDELYYMPIDHDAQIAWEHANGNIVIGDKVQVIKGRTFPHGYVGVVRAIYPFVDRYGRYIADYVYFVEGGKINMNNVKLFMD